MLPEFYFCLMILLRLYKQKKIILNKKNFFLLIIFKIKKLTMEIKSHLIEKINAFEHLKIADEINKMIAIKLKCKDLIKKELFSDVYRC